MRARSHDATLVFSTGRPATGAPPAHTAARGGGGDGVVRIWLEKKGRNGKPVSIVRGLALPPSALAALASRLKRTCGTGGSAKDGEIIIQGDHRARIASELERDGHRVKLAGG
jgi:translation initiation factor 1